MEISQKQKLRFEMKELRNGLDIVSVEALSDQIVSRFMSLDLNDYQTFFVYNSFASEVQTAELIKYLLVNSKKLYMPRVEGQLMRSVPVNRDSVFIKNKYGIKEPVGEAEEINNFVAIIPCLAVDKKGNRIGYGKGYYDEFLKNKDALKIILCYDFQIVDDFMPDEFDIPVDMIITDKRCLFLNNQKEKT